MSVVSIIELGLILAVVLGLACLVAMVAYVIYYYVIMGLLQPARRVQAVVLRKSQRACELADSLTDAFCLSGSAEVDGAIDTKADYMPDQEYFIVFEFLGKQQEFSVPAHVYAAVCEGDTGLLIYRGNLFRDFIPNVDACAPPVKV